MPDLIAPAVASGSIARSDQPWIPVTPDVVLRPWELVDAESVMQTFRDPDIQRWHVRCADSADEAAEWIIAWQRGWAEESQLNWALADRRTGTLLGRASLKCVNLQTGRPGWLTGWPRPHGDKDCAPRRRARCVGGRLPTRAFTGLAWSTRQATRRRAVWLSRLASTQKAPGEVRRCTPTDGTTCTSTLSWPATPRTTRPIL
jgi:hypothetical protein